MFYLKPWWAPSGNPALARSRDEYEATRYISWSRMMLKREMIKRGIIPRPLDGIERLAKELGFKNYRNLVEKDRQVWNFCSVWFSCEKIMPAVGIHRGRLSERKAAEFKEEKMKMWSEEIFPLMGHYFVGGRYSHGENQDGFMDRLVGLPAFLIRIEETIELLKMLQRVAEKELEERRRDLR